MWHLTLPPYPTCPRYREEAPLLVSSSDPPRNSIRVHLTRVHKSFTCFPTCPNFPRTFHCTECKHAEVLRPQLDSGDSEEAACVFSSPVWIVASRDCGIDVLRSIFTQAVSSSTHTVCINSILSQLQAALRGTEKFNHSVSRQWSKQKALLS